MTLTQKLVLYALAVALLPLAATGFTLVRLGETAMRARIEAHQRTAAAALGAKIAQAMVEIGERAVTAMELTDPLSLSGDERLGLLRLLHRQTPAIRLSVFLDEGGALLVRPVTAAEDAAELAADPTGAAAARLRQYLPAAAALAEAAPEVLVSPVYFPPEGPARVAMAVGCCRQGGKARALAGVELALDAEVLKTEGIDTGEGSRVFLVDGFGRVVAHPKEPVGSDLARHAAVRASLDGERAGTSRYATVDGVWVAAFARVGDLGWTVVVEQPEAIAFAQAASMKARTLTWMGGTTVVVLATALAFAGGLRRRLRRLMQGARAFGAGELGVRVPADARDEVGELGRTLNGMAETLAGSLAEIEAWSRTLEVKVDERTRELKAAQAQLLLQSKLAAIGQLGAGVAHEVNNPLAGILGYVQLLLRQRKPEEADYNSLKKIEEAAQRCKLVTTKLLRFSQRGLAGRVPLEVNGIVNEVLDLMGGGLTDAGIEVQRQLAAGLPQIRADAGQLALVLINLVTNAHNAMPSGGRLAVTTEAVGENVRVTVTDTGHGIEEDHLPRIFDPFFTTKKNWTGVGLGLSVAYRIVADHGGRIDVQSKVGEGSRFAILLPPEPPAAAAAEVKPKRPVLLA